MDTGEALGIEFAPMAKNKAAQKLGQLGGLARSAKMTEEERRESSRKAALNRWAHTTEEERRQATKAARAARKKKAKRGK